MTIILRWLIEHVWLFYVGCAIGALIYLVRALAAQREQSLAMFSLEHEAATARAVRAWAMVFLLIAVSITIFIGTRLVVASYPTYDPAMPIATPTPSSGVNPPTPGPTTTLTDTISLPTLVPESETTPVPTAVPSPTAPATPTPGETPAPTPTTIAAGPLSGSIDVRFGEFGALVGWELSASQITVGQPLVLTLFWQGLEGGTSTNYTVFTHLLSQSGDLIAQHDSPPAGGAQNTTEWEAGQVIQDTHQLTFGSEVDDPAGPAKVIVGLYDPEDIDNRLMTNQGQDYVELPVTVNVVPQ